MKVSVSQVSSMGWSFERDLDLYAGSGARAVALLRTKLDGLEIAAVRRAVERSGLEVSGYGTCGHFSLFDRECWPAEIEEARRHIARAAELGAATLTMVTGSGRGRPYPDCEAAFRAIVEQLLPDAERAGLSIALEHVGPMRVDLGFIHTLHDALDLADAIGSPHFSICCEVNNAWTERFLYDDIAARSAQIGLVQISDFAEGTLTTPERVPLGDGIIPFDRILPALFASDYAGWYEIEQLGPEIERLGYEESLRRSLAYLEKFRVALRQRAPHAAAQDP